MLLGLYFGTNAKTQYNSVDTNQVTPEKLYNDLSLKSE